MRGLHVLENIFEEYYRISGLRLHHGKSIWIPLSSRPTALVRQDLVAAAPTWGDLSIQSYGTYLGFALGPDRKGRSWEKALLKMQDRARIWRDIGGGFLVSLSAYRTYILPVASFLLQLATVAR